jgi:hypothetical protein
VPHNGLRLSGKHRWTGPGRAEARRLLAGPAPLEPLALRHDRAGRASGVTGPDGAWPGGAVPAGPPTSTRAFMRCADPSGPRAGTVTTGVCPFQPLVVQPPPYWFSGLSSSPIGWSSGTE